MRIKAFKNFSFGKSKNQGGDLPAGDEQAAEIFEIETGANGKAKGLKKAAGNTDSPEAGAELVIPIDAPPVRRHGPAAELTLEPEDLQQNPGMSLDEIDSDDTITLGDSPKIEERGGAKSAAEAVKIKVQIHATPAAAAPVPEAENKEAKAEESDSLNKLFSEEEEEENPLASLINSLPDVTVQELMDDLAEIHRIIKEWRPEDRPF